MINNVLLTTDFSPLSNEATEIALKVAKRTHAKLHILHVVALPSHVLLDNNGDLLDDCEMDNSLPRARKEEAYQKLNEWKNNHDIDTELLVRFGHFNEESVKYAAEIHADLIIMGSHGVHNYKDKITGSHTEYVAMHSTSPVLTIKSGENTGDINRMVLVSSFTEDDIPNCDAALALQKTFESKLCLLRVNTSNNFLADHDAIEHMKQFAINHGIENADYYVYKAHSLEEGILQFAVRENVDMIMIGSNQRTGFARFLQGCVSAELINHAEKPLLTFPIKIKK
jgi:nucleotide-binding universal stress UspA family protein